MRRHRSFHILSFVTFLALFLVLGTSGLAWKSKSSPSEGKTALTAQVAAPQKAKPAPVRKRWVARAKTQPVAKAPQTAAPTEKNETPQTAADDGGNGDQNPDANSSGTAQPDLTALTATMVASTQEPDEPSAFPKKSAVIAAEDQKNAPSGDSAINARQGGADVKDGTNYLGFALWTLVVLAVIVCLGVALKYLQDKGGLLPTNGKLKIVSQQLIGARSKVLIVEAMGKRYLIGSTPERISLIADMDYYPDETADEEIEETRAAKPARRDSFVLETPSVERVAGVSAPQNQETTFRTKPTPADVAGAAARIRQKLKTLKKINPGS